MEFKTPKPNRELLPVIGAAYRRALDAAREDLVAARKALGSSRELLEHPERKLYAALDQARGCRGETDRICAACWHAVEAAFETLKSMRPGD